MIKRICEPVTIKSISTRYDSESTVKYRSFFFELELMVISLSITISVSKPRKYEDLTVLKPR